jgi:small subunit ribosomal protein S27Ae
MPLKTIQIKQHGKEVIVLNVIASDTIDNVKVKIQEATNTPPVKQRLIFAKQLLNIGTLARNNIQEAATITLTKCIGSKGGSKGGCKGGSRGTGGDAGDID